MTINPEPTAVRSLYHEAFALVMGDPTLKYDAVLKLDPRKALLEEVDAIYTSLPESDAIREFRMFLIEHYPMGYSSDT